MLTAIQVKNAKPGRLSDGGGLYLHTKESGAQSWILRFWLKGKIIERGLGSCPEVSLSEARDKAREWRRAIKAGDDPRPVAKQEEAAVTFRAAADAVRALRASSWKSDVHAAQWDQSLADYAFPSIEHKAVGDVSLADVEAIMLPMWETKHATARKLLSRIGMILDWSIAKGLRTDNPAKANGPLRFLLPTVKKATRHHAALPYTELPAFMAELRKLDSVSARALEFTILTGCRTAEVIEAKRDEIDGAVLVIPAARMKGGKEHRVPLCERAQAILDALPHSPGGWVFPSRGSHLSNMAMLQCLRGLRPGLTVHGFRSTFRDWAADQTDYPHEVVEAALAHTVSDAVVAAYRRTTFFDRRVALLNDWAAFMA